MLPPSSEQYVVIDAVREEAKEAKSAADKATRFTVHVPAGRVHAFTPGIYNVISYGIWSGYIECQICFIWKTSFSLHVSLRMVSRCIILAMRLLITYFIVSSN